MDKLNGNRPLTYCGSNTPNRAMPDIAGGKYAGNVGFEDKWISLQGPILGSISAKKQIRAGANKIILVLLNQIAGYFRAGNGTDKNKDGIGFFRNGFPSLLVF